MNNNNQNTNTINNTNPQNGQAVIQQAPTPIVSQQQMPVQNVQQVLPTQQVQPTQVINTNQVPIQQPIQQVQSQNIQQPVQQVQPQNVEQPVHPQNLNPTNIQQQMQSIPTVDQSKQQFINNTQASSEVNKEKKKDGPNIALIVVLFAIIFAAIFFLFPYLLKVM